jgi:hypothetical protein
MDWVKETWRASAEVHRIDSSLGHRAWKDYTCPFEEALMFANFGLNRRGIRSKPGA